MTVAASTLNPANPWSVAPLWVGVLAGPLAWAVQELSVFASAAWACDGGPHWPMHAFSFICLTAALGGGWVACRHWRAVRGWPGSSDESDVGRYRLMSVVGMMASVLFSMAIVAQWLAAVLLPVCPEGTL